jgi:hypothetical protein
VLHLVAGLESALNTLSRRLKYPQHGICVARRLLAPHGAVFSETPPGDDILLSRTLANAVGCDPSRCDSWSSRSRFAKRE